MLIQKGKEQEYKDWYEKNKDAYGRACFTYAERWAELLEKEIANSDKEVSDVFKKYAEEYSHKADTEGITGAMYGFAVQILSLEWEYGEELRKWHNKKYDYEGSGVVNPAIITVGK